LYPRWLETITSGLGKQWTEARARKKARLPPEKHKEDQLPYPKSFSNFSESCKMYDVKAAKLRTDTCDVCDYYNATRKKCKRESQLRAYVGTMHDEHSELAEAAKARKSKDISDCLTAELSRDRTNLRNELANSIDGMCCYLMDKGSNLTTPEATSNTEHFKTKSYTNAYIVSAFGMHFFFIWHKTEGGAGSDNVCDICEYMYTHFGSGATWEIVWGDNACAQLKSHGRVMYIEYCIEMGRKRRHDSKFLLRGHTYLGGGPDSAHAAVKRRSKSEVWIIAASTWARLASEAASNHVVIRIGQNQPFWKRWHAPQKKKN
jgi:hypothetical protein